MAQDGRELWTGGADGALRKWLLGPPQPFARGVCFNLALSTTKHRMPGCMPANLTAALGLLVSVASDRMTRCMRDRRLQQLGPQPESADRYDTAEFGRHVARSRPAAPPPASLPHRLRAFPLLLSGCWAADRKDGEGRMFWQGSGQELIGESGV